MNTDDFATHCANFSGNKNAYEEIIWPQIKKYIKASA